MRIRNPYAIRPLQHVLEPLRGYLMLAEKLVHQGPVYAEGWNFGPNVEDARPVRWIVEQLSMRWDADAQWHVEEGEQPHEAAHLKLDICKARTMLNWHPMLRLDDALDLVIDWSRQRQAGANVRALTEQQIAAYQKLAQTS